MQPVVTKVFKTVLFTSFRKWQLHTLKRKEKKKICLFLHMFIFLSKLYMSWYSKIYASTEYKYFTLYKLTFLLVKNKIKNNELLLTLSLTPLASGSNLFSPTLQVIGRPFAPSLTMQDCWTCIAHEHITAVITIQSAEEKRL